MTVTKPKETKDPILKEEEELMGLITEIDLRVKDLRETNERLALLVEWANN